MPGPRGCDGAFVDHGEKGDSGSSGLLGHPGPDGLRGPSGHPGQRGPTGPKGYSVSDDHRIKAIFSNQLGCSLKPKLS